MLARLNAEGRSLEGMSKFRAHSARIQVPEKMHDLYCPA